MKTPPTAKRVTNRGAFVTAAIRVLKGASSPLHYSEITDRAMAEGWLRTKGLTPRKTMLARFSEWIRSGDHVVGEGTFVSLGAGQFRYDPPGDDLHDRIAKHNALVAASLLAAIQKMPPREFEHLVGKLFSRLGYEKVEVSRYSKDGGFDVEAYYSAPAAPTVKAKIQVKRHAKAIGAAHLRQLRGSCGVNEHPVFVTSGTFSRDALKEAEADGKSIVETVDGESLAGLLIQHQLVSTTESINVHTLNADILGLG